MIPRHEQPPVGAAAVLAAQVAAPVPVLNTARLILRAPRAADFPAYAEIACSPVRGAGIGGPMTRADAWWDFVQLASCWMLHGHGGWTATLRGDGDTALGFVLVALEPGDMEPELGFLMTAAGEGHGYAHEAAIAARDWAWQALNLPTLVSYIAHGNTRSRRLAERLGALRDVAAEAALGRDHATFVFRHTPPEART